MRHWDNAHLHEPLIRVGMFSRNGGKRGVFHADGHQLTPRLSPSSSSRPCGRSSAHRYLWRHGRGQSQSFAVML